MVKRKSEILDSIINKSRSRNLTHLDIDYVRLNLKALAPYRIQSCIEAISKSGAADTDREICERFLSRNYEPEIVGAPLKLCGIYSGISEKYIEFAESLLHESDWDVIGEGSIAAIRYLYELSNYNPNDGVNAFLKNVSVSSDYEESIRSNVDSILNSD